MSTSQTTNCPNSTLSLGVFLFLAAAVFLAIWAIQAPSPLPATASAQEFSAERAIKHTRVIAQVTHPGGSPADDAVREYILRELKSLDVPAEVQVVQRVEGRTVIETKNVLARIAGTASTKAFAIAAHYDSVPYGPGAADDGVGVVAMLEAARALKAGPALRNDIFLVFTDTEEGGEQGADAFMLHPWASETAVMLNFEARGTQGPSLMFETSQENGRLIEELAKAGVYARASSLMYEVYRRMPFNSDFSVFKREIPGLNVAFVDNFAYYHTKNDNPDHLSLASLQNHGSYALGLARHFGNLDLNEPMRAPDVVYFNTAGSHLVHYPLSWSPWIALLAGLMFVLAVVIGLPRGHLSIGGLLGGAAAFVLSAACVVLFTFLPLGIAYGPSKLYTQYTTNITHLPDLKALYHNNLYGWSLAAFAACVFLLCYLFFRRFIRSSNLALGALLWWVPILVLLQKLLPGGSYYAAWPLCFSSLGLALYFLRAPEKPACSLHAILLGVFSLPGIFLIAPAYPAFLSTVMIFMAPGLVLVVVLLSGLLIPQLELVSSTRRWWMPAFFGGIGIVLLSMGLLNSGYTSERPKLNALAYALDRDTGQAFWLSPDAKLDEWTSQFFPANGLASLRGGISEFDPWDNNEYWKAPAPVAAYVGPQAELVSDSTGGDIREVVLRVMAPDKPSEMRLWLTSDSELQSAEIFGKPIESGRRGWSMNFRNFPREGVAITLRLRPGTKLSLRMAENLHGLPSVPNMPPRPDYMTAEPNTIRRNKGLRSDNILVGRTFETPN